jgi:nucleoside-diphosphate-sugar epimerase
MEPAGSSWSARAQSTVHSPHRFRIFPKPTREHLILACPRVRMARASGPPRPYVLLTPHPGASSARLPGPSQPITIRGDPSTVRSYLYAADLAVWLWTILSRAAPLKPYNVGSDQAISLGALAEEVASVLCPGMPVQIALSSRPGAAGNRYVPAIKRSTEELGLRQTILLRDAIRRTAEWHGWREGSSLQREGRSIETH